MYVAPEVKVLSTLVNVAATSGNDEGGNAYDPNDPTTWPYMPPCL